MRVVFDTNILISILLSRGEVLERLWSAWRNKTIVVCLSEPLFDEFQDVFSRKHIQHKMKLTREERLEIINSIVLICEFVEVKLPIERVIGDDPDDDMVLATAVAARSHVIISGDKHLLDLKCYNGIEIVTARQFLAKHDRNLFPPA